LIADPLSIELSQAASFAQFVLEKTSGNPFFFLRRSPDLFRLQAAEGDRHIGGID